MPCHDEGQEIGNQHGAGDGDAVGRRQVARRTEADHQRDDGNQQEPIDCRDVDLPHLAGRGMAHIEAW